MKELEDTDTQLQDVAGSKDGKQLAEDGSSSQISKKVRDMVNYLTNLFDVDGLRYWAKTRKLIRQAEQGFDLYVTEDGNKWTKVVGDGLNDPYNYGARTFTVVSGNLYLGTANPYYGAQLWKITPNASETGVNDDPPKPAADKPKHKTESTKIEKKTPKITVKISSKSYKAKTLKKKIRKFNIGASVNSKGKLAYQVLSYKSKASKKHLKFNLKSGEITVRKGTPKGKYTIKVKIKAKQTSNYKAATLTKTIKIKVK
jgi:hypothetical protein